QTIPPSQKEQMAIIIGKAIREAARKEGRELVLPPRVEPDERYFLKIHDVIKAEDKLSDRIQMYRVIGLNLVHVACTAIVESRDQSAAVHSAAEQLLDTMRLSRGANRSVYPRA